MKTLRRSDGSAWNKVVVIVSCLFSICSMAFSQAPCNMSYDAGAKITTGLAQFQMELPSTWHDGDIIFFGDSLTDYADYFGIDPLFPRTHNFAINGAVIKDVVYLIDNLENYVPNPSKMYVLIGTNDIINHPTPVGGNTFDQCIADRYNVLFSRLNAFKSTNPTCSIILRSIPPGAPYLTNATDYNISVLQANNYLESLCNTYNFEYVDNWSLFWSEVNQRPYLPYYKNNEAPGFLDEFAVDELHVGYLGYLKLFQALASNVFPIVQINSTGLASLLNSKPSGTPNSLASLPSPTIYDYRYFCALIPPFHDLTVESYNALENYAAIYDIGTKYPVSEDLEGASTSAKATISNNTFQTSTVIVCVGNKKNGNPGSYQLVSQPLNANSYAAGLIKNDQNIEGFLTYNGQGGVYYRMVVPPNSTIQASFSDPVSASAEIAIGIYHPLAGGFVSYSSDSRSFPDYSDLSVSYHSASGGSYYLRVIGNYSSMINQSLDVSWSPQSFSGVNIDSASDSIKDIRPSIAFDGNQTLMAVWQRINPTFPEDPSLVWAKSVNWGVTWTSQQTIFDSTPQDHLLLGPEIENPSLTTDGQNWIVGFSTQNHHYIKKMPFSGYSWSPLSTVPDVVSGSSSTDLNFTVNYRRHSDSLVCSFSTHGDFATTSICPNFDYGCSEWDISDSVWDYVIDTNFTICGGNKNILFPTFGHQSSLTPDPGLVTCPAWVEKYVDPPGSPSYPPERVTIYTLKAGTSVSIITSLNELVSPQVVYFESATYNPWVLVWSMRNHDQPREDRQADLDLYYSRGSADGTIWTQPMMLNSDGLSDMDDDVLGHLVADPIHGVRAVWCKNRSDESDIYGSDFNGSSWNAPQILSASHGTQINSHPRTIWAGGKWNTVYQSTGFAGDDFDIIISR